MSSQPTTPPLWRHTPADATEWFDPARVQRSRDYRRPLKRTGRLDAVVGVIFIVVVLVTHAVPAAISAVGADSFPFAVLTGVLVLLGGTLLGLPRAAWVALSHDRRWGLSTQTGRTFALDQVKELAVGIVLLTSVLLPVYAVIRATPLWWLYGTAVLMAMAVLGAFVHPVLIMPIFNRFTPLADSDLRRRIDDIRAPVLAIHGANDPRVPVSEARQLQACMVQRGVFCALLVYDDEGHGLAKRVNRLDAYPKALAFLARYLATA